MLVSCVFLGRQRYVHVVAQYSDLLPGVLAPLARRVVVASLHAECDTAFLARGSAGIFFHVEFHSLGSQCGGRISQERAGFHTSGDLIRVSPLGPGLAKADPPPNGWRHDKSETVRFLSAMDARPKCRTP